MEICEGQERGLWLVLENKKPVVAFPSKEQAEQYCPIHVAKREDVPIMEIVHISFRDSEEERLLRRPVRIPSVPPGITVKPFLPPKLGPGLPVTEDPIDISKFREALESLKKVPTWDEYFKKPEVYGPVGKWVGDSEHEPFRYNAPEIGSFGGPNA